MMYVALSYDHRIIDGQQAVLFLVRVKELMEDPALDGDRLSRVVTRKSRAGPIGTGPSHLPVRFLNIFARAASNSCDKIGKPFRGIRHPRDEEEAQNADTFPKPLRSDGRRSETMKTDST